jgi:hypothetical protein
MRPWFLFAIATFVAFVGFTLWWAWPIVPIAETPFLQAFVDPTPLGRADTLLTSWMLAWASHALRTNPLGLYDANIFYPLPWTFAFSENLLAGALLALPIDVVSRNPVLDHNALLLATFVLGGTGTALLLRRLGASWPAAWLAGAIVTFNPFRFGSIGHIQANSTHWMPFALLALERCWRRGRGAVVVAITLLLVTLSSVYYAYFFFLALAVLVPLQWALRCPAAPGGRVRALGGIVAAGFATAILLIPYVIARDVYALARNSGEAWFFGAKAITYLGAVIEPVTYATQRYVVDENQPVVIGMGTFVLLLIGLAVGAPAAQGGRRVTTAYFLMALALAFVSLGPVMQWRNLLDPALPGPWTLLAAVVPGFAALRVPVRACTVVVLGVAVVAGLGADALWRRVHRPSARLAVLALLAAIGFAETWRAPFETITVPWAKTGIPAVYRWLAAQPGRDAIVELPLGLPANDATYMVFSATHWRPLVNGYSGFSPTSSYYRGLLFTFPSPPALRGLHAIGVRWVVVHPADLVGPQRALCNLPPEQTAPHLVLAYHDERSCVFELKSAPPAPARPPDRRVSLAGATVTTSIGQIPAAAVDGDVDTHWVAPVDQNTETWFEVHLPAPHPITRVVVQLGPHFGEYMRLWRIDTSLDGFAWTPAITERNPEPPVAQMRTSPTQLSTEMRLSAPTMAQHVRIARMGAGDMKSFDLWANWTQWGVHELELYEAVP